MTIGGTSADGFALVPGAYASFEVELAPGDALRFATATRRTGERDVELDFRVRLDRRSVFERRQAAGARESVVWHEVALPEALVGPARLTIEVDGPPAEAALLAPTLGPADAGRPGARPWGPARPDVVLVVADTLRADALAALGGRGVAPGLDALARDSRLFARAFTPAPWTLPAAASMLTGLFPMQHGATTEASGLAPSLVTLAERLAEHGYRTGAITDGVFVSREYGLDQGFAYWREDPDWNLARTLAAADAFLDADDGRPTFLLVHTYRVHAPYRDRTDADGSEHQDGWDALLADAGVALLAGGVEHASVERVAHLAPRLRGLYEDGVRELDRALVPWVASLRARGHLERGVLVVTSDHGEAFLENGDVFHAGRPYEEKIRVPLFLHGGAVEPGIVEHAASLVDVPATVAALAGVAVDPRWGGRALLDLDVDRPVFSFETGDGTRSVALLVGERLVLAPADPERLAAGEVEDAFELGRGPADAGSEWAAGLAREHAGTVDALLAPLVGPSAVELDDDQRARLRAVGYGGEDS